MSFTCDTTASAYESGRPSYPAAALAYIVGHGQLGPGRRVLDLGAGTGKMTRLLAASGAEVIAVEPAAAMRYQLTAALPDVEVRIGAAEKLPLPSSWVDAVVVAHAFHWFDARAALAEIRRVLRPGRPVFLIWNLRDRDVDWVRCWDDLILESAQRAYEPFYDIDYMALVRDVRGFTAVRRWSLDWEHFCDIDRLAARTASVSAVGSLSPHEREGVLAKVRHLARSHPDLAGRPWFGFPYTTAVWHFTST